jgi:hypothetical protein
MHNLSANLLPAEECHSGGDSDDSLGVMTRGSLEVETDTLLSGWEGRVLAVVAELNGRPAGRCVKANYSNVGSRPGSKVRCY